MTDKTKHVYEQFPAQTELIEKLLRQSSEFSSLCEDYGECVEIFKTLTLSNASTPARIDEYRLLRNELNDEILQVLTKLETW